MKDAKRFWFFLIAALVRISIFGFPYALQLDDYIQYGLYGQFTNPFRDAFLRIGLYYARPLAGLADIFLWSCFWGRLWIPLLLFTVLSALCCYLLEGLFHKAGIRTGTVFAVILLLSPMNLEATYWLSASTRLVTGLFFCLLSLWYASEGKNIRFALLQLISFCFYEQIVILSLCLLPLFANRKRIIISAVNCLLIGLYYLLFSGKGNVAYTGGFSFHLTALPQIITLLTDLSFYTDAFIRGITSYPWCLPSAVMLGIAAGMTERASFDRRKLFFGIVLTLLPFLPFLFLHGRGAALRNLWIPSVGIGLIVDGICDILKGKKRIAAALLTVFFVAGTTTELADYQAVSQYNEAVLAYVVPRIDTERDNAVVGAKAYPLPHSRQWEEHILSIGGREWAITGAIRERLRDPYLPTVMLMTEEKAKEMDPEEVNLIYLPKEF